MKRYICSDLHLGHKNIVKFRCGFTSDEEHDNFVKKGLEEIQGKKSMIFFLGDIALDYSSLEFISRLKARKILICGNHDLDRQVTKMSDLVEVYDDVYSLYKYKGYWLSHAPIHPNELRGKKNLHGHTHKYLMTDTNEEVDSNYINCCMDYVMNYNCKSTIEFDEAIQLEYSRSCVETYKNFLKSKYNSVKSIMKDIPWKPIESAPKDGSQILLKYKNNTIASGSYRFGDVRTEPQPCVLDFRADCCGNYHTKPIAWVEIELLTGVPGYSKGEA